MTSNYPVGTLLSVPDLKFKTVAVIGASGGVGRHVVDMAIAAGHAVRALARDPSKLDAIPGLEIVKGGVADADAIARLVNGADVVISCLGSRTPKLFDPVMSTGAANAVQGMKRAGGRRLIVVSSVGIGKRSAYAWYVRLLVIDLLFKKLNRHQYDDCTKMESIVAESGLDWTIVRPTMLSDGKGGRKLVTSERSREACWSIARTDVARFLVDTIADRLTIHKRLQLGNA